MTKEERKKYMSDYYKLHPDLCKKAMKKWRTNNPEKAKEADRRWRVNNPDKLRNKHLKRKFGITLEQFNLMFDSQKGRCQICDKHEEEKLLAVDHNHRTGMVRGLLCNNCNLSLGLINEDIKILQNMIKYIQNYVESKD